MYFFDNNFEQKIPHFTICSNLILHSINIICATGIGWPTCARQRSVGEDIPALLLQPEQPATEGPDVYGVIGHGASV